MNKILFLITGLIFTSTGWAHNGEDPAAELDKNRSRLSTLQQNFGQLVSADERIDNLDSQVDLLQKDILMLRNLMAKEYPHVKEGMSKYKLDYMELLGENLKKFKLSVKQVGQIIE